MKDRLGDGPGRGRGPRRRGVRRHARRQPGGRGRARGGPAAVRPALRRRARAPPEGRGRAARPGGDPGRQLRGHRRPRGPDRSDPRRRRAAVPVLGAVPRARAGAAEGRAALRASGMRQDADREGRREVARREGRRAHRPRRRPQLLPERQGSGAAQQVRRRDRAPDPRDLPAREGAQRRGPAGHRVLRRDGLDLPHARHGHLLRRGVDDRAAAAVRARRRRDAQERDRDRRLEPRGPDRPGDPAARAAWT